MTAMPTRQIRPITRLAVLDRGESAVRVLNAAGSVHQPDGVVISTVLFTTDASRQPWYGREADDVVQLTGEPTADKVVQALVHDGVDAVWLGECPCPRSEVVEQCEIAGLRVLGPSAAVGRRLTEPAALRKLAALADVPTEPLADGPQLRHVEVEVLADDYGTVWALEPRDVGLSLHGQVVVVDAPMPSGGRLHDALRGAARRLMIRAEYRGAGVVRFAHDGVHLGLLGVDLVAAPDQAITEERTGTSVIGWRIRVACGEALPAAEPAGEGHVLGALLTGSAHDATAAVGDSPASVALLSFPVGTGVRIDANRRWGDPVTGRDDVLAVITAWGPDRDVARQRLHRALSRTAVVVHGGTTNRTFLLDVLQRPEVCAGSVAPAWLEQLAGTPQVATPDAVALLVAAVEAYEADRALAQDAFYATAARGRPEAPEDLGARIELRYADVSYRLQVDRTGPRDYSITHAGTVADVQVDLLNEFERRITCRSRRHRAIVTSIDATFSVELDGVAHHLERRDGTVVRAGWPALVVAALVEPGQSVQAGTPIAVLESMKMETVVTAPFAGEVVAVSITPNTQIERGAPLVRIRPAANPAHAEPRQPVDLDGLERRVDFTRKPCDRVYGPLGDYLLGFDLTPDTLRKLLTQQRRLAEIAEPDDRSLLACEDGLIDIYSELGALYRPKTEGAPDDDLTPAGVSGENTQEYLVAFLQWLDADRVGLPGAYRARLLTALGRYGVHRLDRTPELETALMWLFRSLGRVNELGAVITAILERRLANRAALVGIAPAETRARLGRLAAATDGRQQAIADLARDVAFHYFDEPPMQAAQDELLAEMKDRLAALGDAVGDDRTQHVDRLVWCPHPVRGLLLEAWRSATNDRLRDGVLEVHLRRYYRIRDLADPVFVSAGDNRLLTCDYVHEDRAVTVVVAYLALADLDAFAAAAAPTIEAIPADRSVTLDLVTWAPGETTPIEELADQLRRRLQLLDLGRVVNRTDVTVTSDDGSPDEHLRTQSVTFRAAPDGELVEDPLYRNLHPMLAKRLEIWRLSNFELQRLASPEDVYLFLGVARTNPKDRRLFALAEIRDLVPSVDAETGTTTYPRLERTGLLALAAMRTELGRFAAVDRPSINRIVLAVHSPWTVPVEDRAALAARFAPLAARAGLEKVVVKVQIPDAGAPEGLRPAVLHFERVGGSVIVREDTASDRPVSPISAYKQKVLTAARFGSPYPYEIAKLFTQIGERRPGLPADRFVEMDLGDDDELVPVDRAPGNNVAHLVVGLMINHTSVVPEGVRRVAILSDPTQGLGNLAEPECRRINAALAYAEAHRLPVEWFAVSSGALIAMDSGTENMDWIALTLRRLIEFTQRGGEVNIVVTGINVGGQPYWNAEATMLTHTRGILVMTPTSAMVLTGKQALDFSGAVSAEDNFGIGGFDRVMGPNGQAQYWAPSFTDACRLLLRHYELTYVVPGERFPRRRPTADADTRDVRTSPHAVLADSPFTTVGDVFSAELNPERKQPFDMRSVMRAVADTDSEPLERWRVLRDGDTSIVWDTTVGGIPVCMLGLESHTVRRTGFVPADGPPAWTSGTLFPHSSRKTARAINAASSNRPLVVLANLSGFDGSPESMRRRQLEFGAEIGRAVTNFDGPIVFVVVSRYHGGAFVVFSKALNESMEIAAIEGSYASVIGGAPAAATVFAREVKQRTERDERVAAARAELAAASGADAAGARSRLAATTAMVRSEKLGEVADEFDAIHTIERARQVGSVDRIIAAADLRPYVIDTLERGMSRFTG